MTIELNSVQKSFNDIVALDEANISVPAGSITVLLGPNGAGKTTAIRVITGALEVDAGTVSVFGTNPTGKHGEDVRRRCGVVSAKPSLYDRLNGVDNLRYAAELYDMPRGPSTEKRILEAATQFGIQDALNQEVGGYSTGMKTRLALARAVLHKPDLLLLDEPTSGLDPRSSAAVLDLIRQMAVAGQTVLMCTHLLLEAEGLADRLIVMQQGKTIVDGPPQDLARRYWPSPRLRLRAEVGHELDRLASVEGVVSYERSDNAAEVSLSSLDIVPDLINTLVQANVRLSAVAPYEASLEELYFAIIEGSFESSDSKPLARTQ